jgi:hypothetical protein
MTAVVEQRQAWQAQPGWGIRADLMPPEVLADRKAIVVRRLVLAALLLLLALCILASGVSALTGHSASAALKAQTQRGNALQATRRSFDNVTATKSKLTAVNAQIAGLLGTDTDIEQVLRSVTAAAPKSMTFSQVSVTLNGAAAAGASTGSASGGAALNTGTAKLIGSVTITGTTGHLTDVSSYLDSLAAIKGVIKPYPGAETVSKTGTQFSVQFSLSDALLTNHYTTTGTK